MRREFIERIKGEEGFSAQSYWDDAPGGGGGQWTWGFGTKAPGPDQTTTREQAELELVKELLEAERDYQMIFQSDPPGMTPARREALIDMLFNLGADRFSEFIYTIQSIRAGNWTAAAAHAQQSLWYRQVGSRARRIVAELRTGMENGVAPPSKEDGTSVGEGTPTTTTPGGKTTWVRIAELLGFCSRFLRLVRR